MFVRVELPFLAFVLMTSCVPATHVPPSAGGAQPAATAGETGAPVAPDDPFTLPTAPRDDDLRESPSVAAVPLTAWDTNRRAKGVPPPPPSCAPFARRAPSKDRTGSAGPYAETDPAKRDAMLVATASEHPADAMTIHAIRAELAPIECADTIVDPLLEKLLVGAAPKSSAANASDKPHVVPAMIGLSLAGKLARTANKPPTMGPSPDKQKVKAFIQGPLKAWVTEQSAAIEVLSSGAAGLSGYARGIAAIEAGVADLRLVDEIRSAPVPSSWDPELRSVYEAALDEALEPRKTRGRDAALVGMSDLASAGLFRDARVDRARALLSKLYGGRRIDALDGLLLPAIPPSPRATANEAIAAVVPPFWLDSRDFHWASSPQILSRAVLRVVRLRFHEEGKETSRGLPELTDELRSRYARSRFEMGRVYWRRVDFVEAAHAAKRGRDPLDRLILALSLTLARGPNGAAEMMRAPTPAVLNLVHTEPLDTIVGEGGPLAGLAAYDAAHLRALSLPDGDAAVPFLRDVAARFRKAESLLVDPIQRQTAAQRAVEIDATITAAEKRGG